MPGVPRTPCRRARAAFSPRSIPARCREPTGGASRAVRPSRDVALVAVARLAHGRRLAAATSSRNVRTLTPAAPTPHRRSAPYRPAPADKRRQTKEPYLYPPCPYRDRTRHRRLQGEPDSLAAHLKRRAARGASVMGLIATMTTTETRRGEQLFVRSGPGCLAQQEPPIRGGCS